MQQRIEVVTRRKEMDIKRGRNITLRSRHKLKPVKAEDHQHNHEQERKSQLEVILQIEMRSQPKTAVTTQKPEEEKDNYVVT